MSSSDYLYWVLFLLCFLVPFLIQIVRRKSAKNSRIRKGLVTENELESVAKSAKRNLKKVVVLIDINGPILVDKPVGLAGLLPATSARETARILEFVAKQEGVSGILLRITTPGGSMVGSEIISEAILKCREQGKKVVVYIEESSFSGGVWTMVHANSIVIRREALTGSIGVLLGRRLMKYEGVTKYSEGILGEGVSAEKITGKYLYAGVGKTFGDAFGEFDPTVELHIQSILDRSYDQFVSKVCSQRTSMSPDKLRELGAILLDAEDAKSLGLVDEIGTYETAFRVLREHIQNFVESNYLVFTIQAPRAGLLQKLLSANYLPKQTLADEAALIRSTLQSEMILGISPFHWT